MKRKNFINFFQDFFKFTGKFPFAFQVLQLQMSCSKRCYRIRRRQASKMELDRYLKR